MLKVMVVFGTRPGAIKICPLVKELRSKPSINTLVLVTGRHEMLKQVLDIFNIKPDYDLDVMSERQTLCSRTNALLEQIQPILAMESPDIVLVHGDTTTAFVTGLAYFYMSIPVGHVETGLRTYNVNSPMPEEFNRQATGLIARYHFAPTEGAKQNFLHEGKSISSIFVTGNTAIDALKTTVRPDYQNEDRVRVIEPLDVVDFHNLLARCYMVLTDSGGIQEEAPSLGIQILVMRNTTERPEGIAAGTARLVGTDEMDIFGNSQELLCNAETHSQMSQAMNPYGDGGTCKRIADALEMALQRSIV